MRHRVTANFALVFSELFYTFVLVKCNFENFKFNATQFGTIPDDVNPFWIGVSPDEKTIKSKEPPHARELARRAGYGLESHKITTNDGYILTVHRILPPSIKNDSQRPVVLLQHGIAQSSSEWLINDSGKSLAMYLVDNGYDVWMGNARGNKYSNTHSRLEGDTMEYYNFTFHEMGTYDFPATIDLVLKETKQESINYIGCSIGATMFFVAMSAHPQYTERVHFMGAISPLAFLGHTKTPIKLLAPHLAEIKSAAVKLKVMRINPETLPTMINSQLGWLCFWRSLSRNLCNSIYKMLDEFGFQRIEEIHLETMWKYVPTTTSARTCIHIVQLMNNQNEHFEKYDYGPDGNSLVYGNTSPPQYDLSSVTMPVVLVTGQEEIFTTSEDTDALKKALPNVVQHVVADSTFKVHTDFTHEANAVQQVFEPLIKILNSYNKDKY